MKKLFAILAVMGVLSFGMTQTSYGSGFNSYSSSGSDRRSSGS